MKNYEKINQINSKMELEIKEFSDKIKEKYKHELSKLETPFTLKDLNDAGWIKGSFYGAGDQYLFKKCDVEIRVYPKDLVGPLWAMPYHETFAGQFVDLEHIEDYFKLKQQKKDVLKLFK
jgi:hypothetical protein